MAGPTAGADRRVGRRPPIGIVAGAVVCWAIGGGAAMGLASLSPEFYRQAFVGAPEETGLMLAYAWVDGISHEAGSSNRRGPLRRCYPSATFCLVILAGVTTRIGGTG